jgi:hypothetical protein
MTPAQGEHHDDHDRPHHTDSPVGLAAFFYERFAEWIASGGEPERALTYDELLDDISLYWRTTTAPSAARLYGENNTPAVNAVDVSLPAAQARRVLRKRRSS